MRSVFNIMAVLSNQTSKVELEPVSATDLLKQLLSTFVYSSKHSINKTNQEVNNGRYPAHPSSNIS